MDVVQQQQVLAPVLVLEVHRAAGLDSRDEFGEQAFGRGVVDSEPGPGLQQLVADCLEQVGLAQAHAAVDEQGVVLVARRFGDRPGRGAGEAVALGHDVALECVALVQPGVLGRGGALALSWRRPAEPARCRCGTRS